MNNLQFWQKTYLLTITLFILALCGGLYIIGLQNQRQSMNSEVAKGQSEQIFIAQNFSRDISTVESNIHFRIPALIRAYGTYYQENGILLEVRENDDIIFSSLPNYPGERPELTLEQDNQNWLVRTVDGEAFLYVVSALSAPNNNFTLTYARSLAHQTDIWEQTRSLLAVGCVSVAAFLAIGLYFVLRSLSKPLERLAAVADKFAAGNMTIRAYKKGNDEIGNLAESFNHMADAAENNIAKIRGIAEQNERMTANLSHEIRTPLTAIQGYAEYMLLAQLTEEEQSDALSYIIAESARLKKISERMLRLSTLNPDELEKKPLDVNDLIHRVLLSVQPKASKKNVTLYVGSQPVITVMGDEILLESLFTNLLDNAIKACSDGGEIRLNIHKDDSHVQIEVVDNGRGMRKEELDVLGEPFYRPDMARSRAEGGAGLGVALCYQIIRLHAAKIDYSSILGKGTIVTVEFTT